MSLTSHLKNPNSLITKMFEDKFNNINLFLEQENQNIKELRPITPSSQYGYPWATVGHITEYLLALYIGIPIEQLFPMACLKSFNPKQFEKIQSYNIKKEHLDSAYLPKIISITLYHLSLYETQIRSKGKSAQYIQTQNDNSLLSLSSVATDDIINLYENSLKSFPEGQYKYNPIFDPNLTKMIGGADADLIKLGKNGNTLIDVKTTKNNIIEKQWIYQLMGYVALDIYNNYNLKNISIYLPRQNRTLTYNIEEILKNYTQLKSIQNLRQEFTIALISNPQPHQMNGLKKI